MAVEDLAVVSVAEDLEVAAAGDSEVEVSASEVVFQFSSSDDDPTIGTE